jgi:hypothetical protein
MASRTLADSTQCSYKATIWHFLSYCAEHKVLTHLQFLADKIILSGYAASFVHRLGGSMAKNAIAALKTWHAINNAPWHRGLHLNYTLKGVTRLAPACSLKPARPGVLLAPTETLARGLKLQVLLVAALDEWHPNKQRGPIHSPPAHKDVATLRCKDQGTTAEGHLQPLLCPQEPHLNKQRGWP